MSDVSAATHVFVDGNNVMGSRPDGWWRDRAAAAQRLVGELTPLAGDAGNWTVVFDGAAPDEVPAVGGLSVEYVARHGADAADDRIVELLSELPPGTDALVYTSDRRLRERAMELGARVEGASSLLWVVRRPA